jgi:hypothetical protein
MGRQQLSPGFRLILREARRATLRVVRRFVPPDPSCFALNAYLANVSRETLQKAGFETG